MNKQLKDALISRVLVLDGAMGTMVQRYGLNESDYRGKRFEDWTVRLRGNIDVLVLTQPQIITEIHEAYLQAGADIIETNTFNANAISQDEYLLKDYVWEINLKAAQLARSCADRYTSADKPRFVAGSIGPTGKTLSLSADVNNPGTRELDFERLCEAYQEQVMALVEGGVDILLIETIFDALNAKAALMAIEIVNQKLNRSLPVMVSGTITDASGRTFTGQTIEAFAASLSHYPLLSIGLNCGLGVKQMLPHIQTLAATSPFKISMHANAGLPNALGDYDETPLQMAEALRPFLDHRLINIVGGCCGTTPENIKEIALLASTAVPRKSTEFMPEKTLVLSGLESLVIGASKNDPLFCIGERSNVSGSKKFARLIREKQWSEALKIAKDQISQGAHMIDICMDDALLDARTSMATFLKLIASEPDIARVPVVIDSSDWNVVEAGLRCVQGRSIVNSISLKEGEKPFVERAKMIKSYGAAVVVMLFDEKGQADTFSRKIEVAQRSYEILIQKADFEPSSIVFDPNVLAIGTGMEEHSNYAVDFINACGWIRHHLPGVHLSGGISNLSFAFRGNNVVREAIHSVFLHYAKAAGLTMAIVNPSSLVEYEALDAKLRDLTEDLVLNRKTNATELLLDYATSLKPTEQKPTEKERVQLGPKEALQEALISGNDEGVEDWVMQVYEQMKDAVAVIEGPLMQGMNIVGDKFGAGEMFLPQVVKSARVMKKAVAVLEPFLLERRNSKGESIRKVVLATVKGDVHDIGKNMVGLVLSCNGFEVIDLGVMVMPEDIVEAVIKYDADLLGVSGLIAPSLAEMETVVMALNEANLRVPVMVGGATTSPEHTAVKLAPLYPWGVVQVKDASRAVGVAVSLIGEGRREYIQKVNMEYEELRNQHFAKETDLISIEEARKK